MIIKYLLKDKIILLLLLYLLTTICGYLPYVFLNGSLYNIFRIVNACIIIVLFISECNFVQLFKNSFLNSILLLIFVMSLLFLYFYALGYNTYNNNLIAIFLIYISVAIGYELKTDSNTIINVLFINSIISIILGFASINTYLGSFSLSTNLYLLEGKNQIGVFLASASFYMLMLFKECNGIRKKLALVLFILLFFLLFLIRCRTAIVAFILAALVYSIKISTKKEISRYLVVSVFLILLLGGFILDLINNVFIMERNVSDLNELSTGRFERNENAVNYFFDNLFIGELNKDSNIGIIHNYVLRILVSYGIWGMPIVCVYFLFVIKLIKQIMKPKVFSLFDVGYFVLIIPFFSSLLEPSAPFGPGSVMSFMYIMFGISLRQSINS